LTIRLGVYNKIKKDTPTILCVCCPQEWQHVCLRDQDHKLLEPPFSQQRESMPVKLCERDIIIPSLFFSYDELTMLKHIDPLSSSSYLVILNDHQKHTSFLIEWDHNREVRKSYLLEVEDILPHVYFKYHPTPSGKVRAEYSRRETLKKLGNLAPYFRHKLGYMNVIGLSYKLENILDDL